MIVGTLPDFASTPTECAEKRAMYTWYKIAEILENGGDNRRRRRIEAWRKRQIAIVQGRKRICQGTADPWGMCRVHMPVPWDSRKPIVIRLGVKA